MQNIENTKQKLYFCTVADSRFILETVALYDSLEREALHFGEYINFWVLCIDDLAVETFKKINTNIQTISLSSLNDKELLSIKNSRKTGEFAQTSKSSLVTYLLEKLDSSCILTFVDSDIYFYTNPALVFEDNGDWSVLITNHWFTEKKKGFAKKVGIYNSGLISFKNNDDGKKCAELWRQQCIDWCYNRTDEKGKFTDQFYLEDWIERYDFVHITPKKEVNVGDWSIGNLNIKEKIIEGNKKFFVNSKPLVCYHFHGLLLYLNRRGKIKSYPVTVHHKGIYDVYIGKLQKMYEKINRIDPSLNFRFAPKPGILRLIKQMTFKKFEKIFK